MKSAGPSPPVIGLREEVEPRRVEPAPECQVGREPAAVVERDQVVEPDDGQDVGCLARDEVHEPAHALPRTDSA